jgi:hypothetical protein
VGLDKESIAVPIEKPFQPDLDGIMENIERFAASKDVNLDGIDIRGLIPKMIRGIAGCEGGCPADAKGLVRQGYGNFQLKYIEGGILSADVSIGKGRTLTLKMFPDF